MSDHLRIVDEIRLLRVEPYEEAHREHLAGQVEKLIGELDRARAAGEAMAEAIGEHTPGFPAEHPLVEALDAWRNW